MAARPLGNVLLGGRGQAERAIGFGRFADGPRMDVDTDDARRRRHRDRPRGACGAGAAPEIDERRHTGGCRRQRADDVSDEQMVKRSVEKRERGPLSPAGQRRAFEQPMAALDIGGRQCAQGARHFPEPELAEMFRLERGEPCDERVG